MRKDLKERTKKFAHSIINLLSKMPDTYALEIIKKQLVKAGTSVAANYHASQVTDSRRAFLAKINIVVEEADECLFWLKFLDEGNLEGNEQLIQLEKEAGELKAIFLSIRLKVKKSIIAK